MDCLKAYYNFMENGLESSVLWEDLYSDSSNSSPIFSVSEISGNGISVSLQSQRNNQHLFSVNGISVPISAKNHRDCDCNFVWQAALTVRYAVIERKDLKALCNSLGGTTVFRLLHIVAEKDAYDYFRYLAQETVRWKPHSYRQYFFYE